MGAHFRLSPSSADRWMACAAAPSREAGIPDKQNVHAIEGTFAHALAAHCLRTETDPVAYFNQRGAEFLSAEEMHGYLTEDYGDEPWAFEFFDQLRVDEEMVSCINGYTHFVRSLAGPGDMLFVEQRFDLSDMLGEPGGGTGDAVIIQPEQRRVHVVDLKYGRKRVTADKPQTSMYAVGAVDNFAALLGIEIDFVDRTIYQPRIDHVDTVSSPLASLLVFREEAGVKAHETRQPDAPAVAGDHCYWCKAKGLCPEYAASVIEEVNPLAAPVDASDFEQLISSAENAELFASPAALMGPAEIARLLPTLDFIKGWADAVKEAAQDLALRGELPGYKMVPGRRGARAWLDAQQVEDIIRNSMRVPVDVAYKMTLISPTQAEKALKPKQYKRLQEFIVQAPGKPTLVPESDSRDPVPTGAATSDFEPST